MQVFFIVFLSQNHTNGMVIGLIFVTLYVYIGV